MIEFVYFEDSWNEEEKTTNRHREVLHGRAISTGSSSNDSEGPRRQK